MRTSVTGPQTVTVGNHHLGRRDQLFLILGPCVIESEKLTLDVAVEVARISRATGIPVLFKSSFDKANRTSVTSFRGPGLENGLRILADVREKTGLSIVSDIHTPDQAALAGEVLDVIQIPALLCRQTDLLLAAGRTGKAINIKKGQFQSPEDMEHAVKKVLSTGNRRIFLTERGACFGYGDLVADMRSILRMKPFGFPVVFDATHSSQFPGGGEGCSSGERSHVAPLASAAVAAGADGIFMEVHPDPDRALCDGPNSLALEKLEPLAARLQQIHKIVSIEGTVSSKEQLLGDAAESSAIPLEEKLKKIRLMVFDVDGVLTDGKITFGSGGLEIKSFHVRDGHGIKIAKRFGLEVALVTGRTSEVVVRRAEDLGITRVYQGVWDKKPVLAELLDCLNLRPEEVAVVGDDVVDIPLLRRAGVGVAVADAAAEVRMAADYVTKQRGGHGAAREMIEVVLKAQGKWDDALARYYE
ncbi:MAG TPA: 3-deoxy-8-phosphooctulonate synthase [Desulfomonilaceae bacterium]|nr:3-deoxy-8-phosphooctulonate synthase [Desulfomonilaceae bacterium]